MIDLAVFALYMKPEKTNTLNSPVLVFGGIDKKYYKGDLFLTSVINVENNWGFLCKNV